MGPQGPFLLSVQMNFFLGTVSDLEIRIKLIDDFEYFRLGTIFPFNPTDIFVTILKVMNAPLEIVPHPVSSRSIPRFAGLTATGISDGVNQILSKWDKNTTRIFRG